MQGYRDKIKVLHIWLLQQQEYTRQCISTTYERYLLIVISWNKQPTHVTTYIIYSNVCAL